MRHKIILAMKKRKVKYNKMTDKILPFVYMLGILLLVLPAFLQSNSKLKQFLTNLAIWIVIILIILTITYFLKNS